jgi:hypothetical protein
MDQEQHAFRELAWALLSRVDIFGAQRGTVKHFAISRFDPHAPPTIGLLGVGF